MNKLIIKVNEKGLPFFELNGVDIEMVEYYKLENKDEVDKLTLTIDVEIVGYRFKN